MTVLDYSVHPSATFAFDTQVKVPSIQPYSDMSKETTVFRWLIVSNATSLLDCAMQDIVWANSLRRCRLVISSRLFDTPTDDIHVQKVAIFVDVQNIYYTTRQAFGRQFDYRAFWSRVTADREVIAAFAYAIERNDSKQKAFQQILCDIGFEVKLKPYIQRSDGSSKGDWDVGITLDLIEQAETADVIVLASGDGDFDLALDRVYTKFGVSTEVYGVEQLTAGSLIKTANSFFAIENELLLG